MGTLPPLWQIAVVTIAFFTLLANAYFSILRYRHDKSSRNISASMKLIEEYRSEKMREARHAITRELRHRVPPHCGYEGIEDKTLRNQVISLSHLLDEIGARVVYDEIDSRLLIALLGRRIIEFWDILAPYIQYQRGKKGNVKNYQAHFEALAWMARLTNIEADTLKRMRDKLPKMDPPFEPLPPLETPSEILAQQSPPPVPAR